MLRAEGDVDRGTNSREGPIRSVVASLIFLLSIAACSDITALPHGSERFDPPPVYQKWWEMTEACSGRAGKLSDVAWYVVPGATTVSEGTGDFNGIWSQGGNTIVLAAGSQMEGALVRHEMLHALLYGGEHSRALFLGTCAGVVACEDECVTEAGPPPTPAASTPRVPPDSIVVNIEVEPSTPNGATLGGWFALTVTAHNPANHSVVVVLPPSGDAGPSFSFSWSLSGNLGAFYADQAHDPTIAYFAAGETKRDVFDLFVGAATDGNSDMPPGDYIAVGGYGDHGSAAVQVTLAP